MAGIPRFIHPPLMGQPAPISTAQVVRGGLPGAAVGAGGGGGAPVLLPKSSSSNAADEERRRSSLQKLEAMEKHAIEQSKHTVLDAIAESTTTAVDGKPVEAAADELNDIKQRHEEQLMDELKMKMGISAKTLGSSETIESLKYRTVGCK